MARSRISGSTKMIVIRKRTLRIGAVVTAVLAVVVGIVLIAQAGSSKAGNEASSGSGAARIAVDREQIDEGTIQLGKTIQTVFKIHNVGTQDLTFQGEPRVEVAEGCCPPRAVVSSATVKPGQEATLVLTYMMHEGMGGKHRFIIHVKTNDPTQPEKQLTVLSNWV